MARRKKKAFYSFQPNLNPEVAQEIIAIILLAAAILLMLAFFGLGGSAITAIFHGLRLAFGFSAYLLPLVFVLISWMLFQPDKYEVKPNNYFGFTGFIVMLSGLLHIAIGADQALDLTQQGLGGGLVGYGLARGLLIFLNVTAAAIVLLMLLLICLVTAANARISDIFKNLFGRLRRGTNENIQINEPTSMLNRLPIKGTLGGNPSRVAASKEEFDALTANADPDWTSPGIDLLEEAKSKADAGNIKENAATISQTLASFGIDVTMGEVNVGPTVTQYTLKPSSGVKLTKITGLDHNLALSLAAHPIRIEAPIPGKSAVGVEIPNKVSAIVRLKDIFVSPEYKATKSPLEFALGRDVAGKPMVADLSKMPHLLIAGATGSGKSVMINDLLMGLLYRNSPADLKLILVDPKRVELSLYNDIPHLLSPVIVEPEKCISALKWATAEMERRYKVFAEEGKRNIGEYNSAKKEEGMPYIVIIIDELADLMSVAAQEVEGLIVRLAQMARATGIHLVLATQRPSVDVITGLIKANIPARIAFSVASQFDSRTILDQAGAEKLLGKGDMLFSSPEFIKPRRVQGVFISDKEVKGVTDYLRNARAPQYNEEILAQPVRLGGGRAGGGGDFETADDDLFQEAADTVIRSGKASASLLQRRLRVGYARAARLLDLLEERGVVGPPDGARPRDVLVSSMGEVDGSSSYSDDL